MADENTIELPSVVQRFREAGEALETLRARLRALELAEDAQTRSAQSIGTASDVLVSSAHEMSSITETMRAACSLTEQAMESTRRFLEGTDLSGLRTSIDSIENVMAGNQRTTDEQLKAISEAVATDAQTSAEALATITALAAKIENDLVAARSEAARANAAREALEAKIQAIPEKTRRKLGL